MRSAPRNIPVALEGKVLFLGRLVSRKTKLLVRRGNKPKKNAR